MLLFGLNVHRINWMINYVEYSYCESELCFPSICSGCIIINALFLAQLINRFSNIFHVHNWRLNNAIIVNDPLDVLSFKVKRRVHPADWSFWRQRFNLYPTRTKQKQNTNAFALVSRHWKLHVLSREDAVPVFNSLKEFF